MKVLHLVPSLFGPGGQYGGGERYALELSRAMAARAPTRLVGFSPSATSATAPDPNPGALAVFTLRNRLPGARFASSPVSPGLLRHLFWADVIHCHQIHNLSADLATGVAALRRRPAFGTDHGGGGWSLRRGAGFSAFLPVSRFSQELLPPRIPSRVIGCGVDTQRFQPADGGEREVGVLFVGRLLPHKGLDILLPAAARAGVPVTVVGRPEAMAGPGREYFESLRRLAAELGHSVRFVTDCDDRDLVAYYQRASCVALPSVYQSAYGRHPLAELLGQTLIEAMACATPVIASRVGGMPEVVLDGQTGFLVEPGEVAALAEKIAWFRDHPRPARAMGAVARDHVLAHFTWDAVVGRCLDAYAEIASRRGSLEMPRAERTSAAGFSLRSAAQEGNRSPVRPSEREARSRASTRQSPGHRGSI